MKAAGALRLTLFFTRGASLRVWEAGGMLAREIALYARLRDRGVDIGFMTYGGQEEREYARKLPGIRLLYNRWGLPRAVYEQALPLLHARWLRRSDILKTNQLSGAEIALRAARLWRKPLIARCGYIWSEFAAREQGQQTRAARRARRIEERVFGAAWRVVVTTRAMQEDVARRVPAAAGRTMVIPNYVDIQQFRPRPGPQDGRELVFVGRLAPQKNVGALLEAIRPLECNLTLIGEGSLREELTRRFADLGERVRWRGNVPHAELPEILGRAALFVLPSHYEGQPKALLEAMACGVAVIGADSPGIRELLRHGETGWLCGTDPGSIREAVRELLDRPGLCAELGRNARAYVERHFSLDRVAELEFSLYEDWARGEC